MTSRYRIGFFLVVWLGILGNWAFAAIVLFFDPNRLLARLTLGPVESTVWLFNYSVLLAILSCFYVPAATNPIRYRANAWLLVAARLVPASTFFVGVGLGFMPSGFLRLGIADASIGLVELVLLRRVLATDAGEAGDETGDAALRGSVADPTPMRRMRAAGRVRIHLVILLTLVAAAGVGVWSRLFRDVPRHYASDEEHFQYGSVGVEGASGLPYWIWYALPAVFPDKLPPGATGDPRVAYASFGFIWPDGHDAPIGLPVRRVGFDRIGVNCALCHTGSVRRTEGGSPEIISGAPASRLDLQRYLRFLFACAADPRFEPAALLPAIERIHPLSLADRMLYRTVLIPQTRKALLRQKAQLAWMDASPDWGPGRSDPFNPAKLQLLGAVPDGTVGNADPMPLWRLAYRATGGLHWDGLNTSLDEIFLNSAIGNGASGRSIDRPALARMEAWTRELAPPAYPFAIDSTLAARGSMVFDAQCGGCHGREGWAGSPVPLAVPGAGTDAHRLASWSQAAADGFNGLSGYEWRYVSFRATSGYVAVPLDGIWARAPYLHNGSVPTLAALLEPPAHRPDVFYRGYDVYDADGVGFRSSGAAAQREGWRFDTRLPGNGNGGHTFGTDLSVDDKHALLEHLKTL
jgi:hypothetical protein